MAGMNSSVIPVYRIEHLTLWHVTSKLMKDILIEHSQRYPYLAMDDLYKLIYQATMGPEHSLSNKYRVRDWLWTELNSLGPGPDDPLIDPVSPDGKIVRIHLRPFLKLNLNQEKLFHAFMHTAQIISPSTKRLSKYSDLAKGLAADRHLSFDMDKISKHIQRLRDSGFPAVHHSKIFKDNYMPAYRIVARDLIPEEILTSV